jgi:hypothetical protein
MRVHFESSQKIIYYILIVMIMYKTDQIMADDNIHTYVRKYMLFLRDLMIILPQ